jgi:hypothetical protein
MQPATSRKILGLLFVLLFVAAAARDTPAVADEDPISSPIGTNTGMSTEAWANRISDAISSATDPGSSTVSDPTDAVRDTVSDPTDAVSDTVSDSAASVSDTVSDATGAASGATGRGSDYGLGVGASAPGNTPNREGQDVPCDAETSTCTPDAAEGDSALAGAVERILGLLAQTGWAVLPLIVIAVGLTVLGIFLLRSSTRRTSRT